MIPYPARTRVGEILYSLTNALLVGRQEEALGSTNALKELLGNVPYAAQRY